MRAFVKHCRVMEADIEIYKKKSSEAEVILEEMRKSGESSIVSVL